MKFRVTYLKEIQDIIVAGCMADAVSLARGNCSRFPEGTCKILSIYQDGSQPLPPVGLTIIVSPDKKGLADHIGDEFRRNHPYLFTSESP